MAHRTPIAGTGKRRKYNPERRTWRGRSYRNGKRVRDMRAAS